MLIQHISHESVNLHQLLDGVACSPEVQEAFHPYITRPIANVALHPPSQQGINGVFPCRQDHRRLISLVLGNKWIVLVVTYLMKNIPTEFRCADTPQMK